VSDGGGMVHTELLVRDRAAGKAWGYLGSLVMICPEQTLIIQSLPPAETPLAPTRTGIVAISDHNVIICPSANLVCRKHPH
jgi:hypothetical protein